MNLFSASCIRTLALLLISSVHLSSCSTSCSSLGNELLYDYESEVQVRINDVVPVTSLYKLKGELLVHQAQNSDQFLQCNKFQFKNLKYLLYHGDMEKKDKEEHYTSAPTEASDLYNPFHALYINGTFDKMKFKNSEKQWSVNMKKSLVSTFQLPPASLVSNNSNTFGIVESSMYGHCKPEYSSVATDSGYVVTKVYFTNNCEKSVAHSLDVEQIISRENVNGFNGMKKYEVNTVDYKNPVIKSIQASEEMHNSLLHSIGERRLVLITQSIKLKDVKTDSVIANTFLKDNEEHETINDLMYHQTPTENPFGLLYATNGRGKFDGNHKNKVIKQLTDAVDYMEKNQLKNLKELQQNQIINELLMHLRYLNSEEIKSVFEKVSSSSTRKEITMRNIFLQMLPVIGTKSSVKFIIDLLKGNVDNDVMGDILMDMPYYVLDMKENIGQALDLLKLSNNDNLSNDVKNGAILAFSIMYGKLCGKSNKNIEECNYESIKLIADIFFQGVVENEGDYLKQLVHIEALKNLNVIEAVNYLEQIIERRNIILNDDLRIRAMMGPHPITKFPSKVYKTYMPIFKNVSEPVEIRAVALQMLLDYQLENSGDKQFSLHWHMADENSHRLYNFYYTLLKSYAESVNPQHQQKKASAEGILQVTRKPSIQPWENTAWMYNYISKPYGYGYEFILKTFGDGKRAIPNMFYAELNSIWNNAPVNDESIYIRNRGLQDAFIEYLLKGMKAPTSHPFMDSMMTRDQVSSGSVEFEAVLQRQGYTCAILFIRPENQESDDGSEDLGFWSKLKNMNEQYLFYSSLTDSTYLTDIGVPVILNMHYPVLTSAIGNFDINGDALKIQLDLRATAAGGTNLLVFNPVANTWHGVARVHSADFQLPIDAEIIINRSSRLFKFSLQRTDGDGHIGFQVGSRTYSSVFNGDSPVPTNFVLVTKNSPSNSVWTSFAENLVYSMSKESNDLAYDFNLASYGCSGPKANEFISSERNQDRKYSSSNIWANLNLFEDYLNYMPSPGNCSLGFHAAPKSDSSGSKFSIKIKINGGETAKVPLPGYKFNIQTEIQLSADSRSNSRTIYIDTDFSSSPNGINTIVKSKLSSAINGVAKGDSIIIDFEKTFPPLGSDAFKYGWGDETVTTKMSIKQSDSRDSSKWPAININVKGEISDEQKRIASSDVYPYNQCEEDKKKPEWQGPLWPRTWACFEGSVKLFYTRKVTLEMETENVSNNVNEFLESTLLSSLVSAYKTHLARIDVNKKLSEENKRKLIMTVIHSATNPTKNIELNMHSGSYKFNDVPGIDRNIWNLQLDNTHFSKLLQFVESTAIVRSCVVSSSSVLTPDNATISHQLGSNYEPLSKFTNSAKYGVYAKKSQEGLVLKAVIGDAILEVSGETVTLNGKSIQNLEQGYQYPADNPYYYLRLWSNQGQITMYSQRLSVYFVYSPVSITLDQTIFLKGVVDGLCGNLNGDPNDDFFSEKRRL